MKFLAIAINSLFSTMPARPPALNVCKAAAPMTLAVLSLIKIPMASHATSTGDMSSMIRFGRTRIAYGVSMMKSVKFNGKSRFDYRLHNIRLHVTEEIRGLLYHRGRIM